LPARLRRKLKDPSTDEATAPLGYRLRERTATGADSVPAVRLMASKTEETPQKEEMPEKEGPEILPDLLETV